MFVEIPDRPTRGLPLRQGDLEDELGAQKRQRGQVHLAPEHP